MSPVLTRTPVKQIKPRSNPCKSNRWQTVSGWWTASRKIDCFQWMWRDDIWNKVFTVYFIFFFFQRIQVSFEAVICSRFGFDLAVFAWEARLSTGFLIELTQITSGDYQVVRKPPEGTMFVYHSADSLHRHIRSPECFIVPRKVSRHSSRTRNHTIRRRPLSATVVLM